MAIVNARSDLFHNYLVPTDIPPDTMQLRGATRNATFTVTNAASDNATSRYALCKVPSNGIVDRGTSFQVQNWGFATVQIGTATAPTALLNVAKSAANVQSPFAFGDANHGKRWWQVLGFAADPGGEIELYAYAPADATAAGTLKGEVTWRI